MKFSAAVCARTIVARAALRPSRDEYLFEFEVFVASPSAGPQKIREPKNIQTQTDMLLIWFSWDFLVNPTNQTCPFGFTCRYFPERYIPCPPVSLQATVVDQPLHPQPCIS